MRQLATIRTVSAIEPIENADNLELAHVDGWQCVVKKGDFKVGDLAVYFEIDSFLPVKPQYEFLRKGCFRSTKNLGDGFRIKTMKLRGTLSQGLLMPVMYDQASYILEDKDGNYIFVAEGNDVTDDLGVQKYEAVLPTGLTGVAKGNFPSFIPKTDQERIQNCFGAYSRKYADHTFVATKKLDGSSMTVYFNEDQFGVCSRNIDLIEDPENLFWKTALKLHLNDALKTLGRNIAIQGELMGPGVQGNREGLKEHKFFIFDIFDIDKQKYMTLGEKITILEELNFILDSEFNAPALDFVPFINYLKVFDELKSVNEILEFADCASINHDVAEGVVFRSQDDTSISFKAINNRFLLKEKD